MAAVLVFRHVPHEMLGTVATALAGAGLGYQYVDLFYCQEIPRRRELERSAGLVVLGGPMNVEETDKYPFLAPEVQQLREAVAADLPVLGICLGAQLLAKALDAAVTANPVKEIGWYPVQFTAQAAADPLLADCGHAATVFQWHGDAFALPSGAVHLARSKACENQAFRCGSSAYGLQFHLEMTADMIEDWLGNPDNRCELAKLHYIDPLAIRRQTPQNLPLMQALGARVFERFASMCQRRAERLRSGGRP